MKKSHPNGNLKSLFSVSPSFSRSHCFESSRERANKNTIHQPLEKSSEFFTLSGTQRPKPPSCSHESWRQIFLQSGYIRAFGRRVRAHTPCCIHTKYKRSRTHTEDPFTPFSCECVNIWAIFIGGREKDIISHEHSALTAHTEPTCTWRTQCVVIVLKSWRMATTCSS